MKPIIMIGLAAFAFWARRMPQKGERVSPFKGERVSPFSEPGAPTLHSNYNGSYRPAPKPKPATDFDRKFDAAWPKRPTQLCDMHFDTSDGVWRTMH